MYAVIETGGRQYKVAVGDKLKVGKLAAGAGASLEFTPASFGRVLMVADGEQITAGPPAAQTPVSATVLGHGLDDKIRVFKRKRRKDYRRTQGHRQSYTEIEITAIGGNKAAQAKTTAASKSAPKSAPKSGVKAETGAQPSPGAGDNPADLADKKTVAKKTTAGKAAGKQTTAGKTTAKKKPAATQSD